MVIAYQHHHSSEKGTAFDITTLRMSIDCGYFNVSFDVAHGPDVNAAISMLLSVMSEESLG